MSVYKNKINELSNNIKVIKNKKELLKKYRKKRVEEYANINKKIITIKTSLIKLNEQEKDIKNKKNQNYILKNKITKSLITLIFIILYLFAFLSSPLLLVLIFSFNVFIIDSLMLKKLIQNNIYIKKNQNYNYKEENVQLKKELELETNNLNNVIVKLNNIKKLELSCDQKINKLKEERESLYLMQEELLNELLNYFNSNGKLENEIVKIRVHLNKKPN